MLFVAAHTAVFQLGEQLNEKLPQRRHDVRRIHGGQLADDAHGHLADLEYLGQVDETNSLDPCSASTSS